MQSIPMHETSVRAVVPLEGRGSIVLCGLPGFCISHDGSPYFSPEHSEQTFEYLAGLGVSLVYLFMENFELPPQAKEMIDATASQFKISAEWIPIVDYATPDDATQEKWKAGRSQRFDCLDRGESIAVTCLYGAGRSGMMAAATVAEMGVETRKAVSFVRQNFVEAVGSLEQERWVAGGTYLT